MRGKVFAKPVEWDKEQRPAMPGSDDIPGTEGGEGQPASSQHFFRSCAHADVGVHHGRRMGHTQVHEVCDLPLLGDIQRSPECAEVDAFEFGGLPWIGMRGTDQLHECIAGIHILAESAGPQRIAGHRHGTMDHPAFGAWPHEDTNGVSPCNQCLHEWAADVARPTRDKHTTTPRRVPNVHRTPCVGH